MSDTARTPGRPAYWVWIPLALFALFLVLVFRGLAAPESHDIHSAMIGKPLPEFALPAASSDRPGLSRKDVAQGGPKLLNFFASWCLPCAAEAPQLAELSRRGATIEGIATRDRREDLDAFLARNGNPYARIGADDVSAVQLAIGSSGVPETFVIDGKGVIRYQHIGDIRKSDVGMLLAKLKEAGS